MALNISNSVKEKAIETIKERYNIAENAQKALFNNFIEYYKVYRAKPDSSKQNYSGRANLFIPYAYSIIETIYPRMINSKPRIYAYPREKTDILKAKLMEKVLEYQWYQCDMKNVVKNWIKQALIYGTGIVKTLWNYNENGTDKPSVINVDLFDFFIDPNASNINDANYIIHKSWKSIDSLKEDNKYTLPRELKGISVKDDSYKTQRDSVTNKSKENDSKSKMVELYEYWGSFDLGDGEEQCLLVLADKKWLIRAEKNPFKHGQKPFIEFKDIVVPNEFWGIGEVESTLSLQYELNDTRNQRIDNVTQILANRPIVSRQAGVENYEVENWQNGNILYVNGNPESAVGYNRPPDVTSSAYNEETMIKSDLSLVSGINDLQPMVAGKNVKAVQQTTATGASLQAEEANARFRAKLDNLEDALAKVGKQLVGLNAQFWDTEEVVRIVGEQGAMEFMTVRKEDINDNYDIIVEVGASQNQSKQIKRQEAIELMNSLMPLVQSGVINQQALIKNLLDSYDIVNVDEFLQNQNMINNQQIPQQPQTNQPII